MPFDMPAPFESVKNWGKWGDAGDACNARKRWEFFLSIAPLRVKRSTGSPVNPVAIFQPT